jgi:hypothetical protein
VRRGEGPGLCLPDAARELPPVRSGHAAYPRPKRYNYENFSGIFCRRSRAKRRISRDRKKGGPGVSVGGSTKAGLRCCCGRSAGCAAPIGLAGVAPSRSQAARWPSRGSREGRGRRGRGPAQASTQDDRQRSPAPRPDGRQAGRSNRRAGWSKPPRLAGAVSRTC